MKYQDIMIYNYFKNRRLQVEICLFLVLVILFVYYQSIHYDFVNYDDEVYVTENMQVKAGLTFEGIIWAFTTGHGANWHPLTWISHMLDCELFGLNPMGHHWINLQLHIANTILLFLFFNWATGAVWRSGLVAAIFAIHPLHVESVAWIAERKNVLFALFMILSMLSYTGYVRHSNKVYYVLLIILFVLGLMAKPMIVTLPFVLLLLDFWPLSRFQTKNDKFQMPGIQTGIKLVLEKIPLFILSAASCIATFFVQQQGGAVVSVEAIPLTARVANACVSYIRYIGKMIYPVNLTIFYPQQKWPFVWVIMSALLLLGVSALVIRGSRKFQYLVTGWFWYLGTLVPVIGLVQVGSQSIADRYTYIPLIGLFIVVAWGLSDISAKFPGLKNVVAVFLSVMLIFFIICAWFQVGYWKNGITLFTHALKVTHNNSVAHCELGHVLDRHGKHDEAIIHYLKALQINPNYAEAHNNLGYNLANQGKFKDAVYHYNEALRLDPKYVKALNNLGTVLARQGNFEEAVYHFNQALQADPNYARAYYNLGKIYSNQGEIKEAIGFYRKALRFAPNMAQALYNLSWTLASCENEKLRNGKEAVRLAEKLCKITKNNEPLALDALAAAYAETGNFDSAISVAKNALKIALQQGPEELALGLKERFKLYQEKRPYRQRLCKEK
jgi:tetratricopeptide (TPR) repeat protein